MNMNDSNSRISTRVNRRGDITTRTINNPTGLEVEVSSGRFGKEGTAVSIGFDSAPNRRLKLTGREARSLFQALEKHYAEFIYAD